MLAWIKSRRPPPAMPACAAALAPLPAPDTMAPPDHDAAHGSAEPDTTPPLAAWLLDLPALDDAALPTFAEQAHLARLEALAADPARAAGLVPRAAAVVPQLLRVLRDDNESRRAWAERISKDPVLTAEVLRLAASARYGPARELADLEDAVAALGVEGVRAAITRVVLKPVFQGAAGSLSQRAAPRLWQHAQHMAWRCSGLAADAGLNAFEGYLAGLLHDTGWSIVLRTVDGAAPAVPAAGGGCPVFTRPFADRLPALATRLFARVLADWRLTPALGALAAELIASPTDPEGAHAAHGASAFARVLHRADRLAACELT